MEREDGGLEGENVFDKIFFVNFILFVNFICYISVSMVCISCSI